MYMVREHLNNDPDDNPTYELSLLTSSDFTNWTYQGRVIETGAEGDWDQTSIYRSCPVTNSAGEIVFFGDNIRMYYSGYAGGVPEIGIADIHPDGYVQKFRGYSLAYSTCLSRARTYGCEIRRYNPSVL